MTVYETILPEESEEAIKEVFVSMKKTGKNIGLPDNLDLKKILVTFTSYSTVENFANALKNIDKNLLQKVIDSGVRFASIGSKTADYALGFGIKSDIISKDVNIDSLVDGIVDYYKKINKNKGDDI